jgi:hypothetical protein
MDAGQNLSVKPDITHFYKEKVIIIGLTIFMP